MKRSLPAQMCHEWKTNIWIVIELFIVLAVIWFTTLSNMINIIRVNEPKGFDETDVYTLNINYISSESPEYVDMGEATDQNNFLDQKVLIERIRRNPNVEAAAFSDNALPYYFSYWGNSLRPADKKDSIGYNGNWRSASPDIARVLRLRSETGKSVADLEKMLRNKEFLLGRDAIYESQGRSTRDLVGTFMTNDTVNRYKIGDMIQNIKRSEFEPSGSGTILAPIDESLQNGERHEKIALRVRPGMGKKFTEDFNSDPKLRQQRNVVLSSLSSLEATRDLTQRADLTDFRSVIGIMVLFLVIVFLGILGSFWYRVQQRNGEIAMRKVCGATRRQIFARLMGEGTLLLSCSAILCAILAVVLLHYFQEQVMGNANLTIFIICGFISLAFMEIMILLGILFPARRAMKVEPAIALKDE